MRLWNGLAVGLLLMTAHPQVQPRLAKEDGDRFQAKLARIVALGNTPKTAKRAAQSTVVNDVELNSYLRFNAQDQMPVGIVEPTLNAHGDGIVSGRAIVDLDAVRKQKQRGWLDPMGYLTGRLPLTARGTLDDGERRRAVRARDGGDLRRDGAQDRWSRSCSASTRARPKIPTASTWTIRSSCPRRSARSASPPAPPPSSSNRARPRCRRVPDRDYLQTPLQFMKGVGPRRAADLQRVGLATVEDLLYRFPIRYEDRGIFQTIASLQPGRVGVDSRRSGRLRHAADAPSALQDLRDDRARRDRLAARRSGSTSRS